MQFFKEKDLKLFSADKVFGHLIADLQDLECNGVNVPSEQSSEGRCGCCDRG